MGQNYQDGKYALSMPLFVSFHCDLESKWAIREPSKKYPIDKYTKESNGIALFSLQTDSIKKKLKKIRFVKSGGTL